MVNDLMMTFSNKFTAYFTIATKEVRRTLRLWIQTLLPPMVSTILYFIIFGHVIGSRIGLMAGVPYLVFIAPGLILMPMIINAFASSSTAVYSAKMMRQIEELLVSPMSEFVMLMGFMTGGIFRGLIIGSLVTLITLFFVHFSVSHIGLVLLTALLSCAFFSLFGILNGVLANSFDDIALIPNFVLSPLIYLGGVFYSIDVLPRFWYHLTLLNPLFYIVDCFRFAFIHVSHVSPVPALLVLCTLVLSLFLFVWYLLKIGYRLRY